MKKIAVIALLLFNVGVWAQEIKELTLKEAVNYALENKNEAKKARLEIEKSNYKIKEVRANALPNVSVSGGINYNPLLQETVLPGEIFGQPGRSINVAFGQKWNANATAVATQVLFNQTVFTGLKAARTTREFYILNNELTEEQVIEKVAKAYFQVYKTQQQLNNLESNLALTQKTVDVIKGLFDAGLAKKIDLDRVNVTLNNLKSARQQLVNAVEITQNALKFMIGMPMDSKVKLPENTFEPSVLFAEKLNKTEDRTEIKLMKKKLDLLDLQKKASQSEYYPSAALVATYGYLGQGKKMPLFHGKEDGVFWSDMATIGLKVNVPIFSGFSIKSKVQQNEIEIMEAEEDLKNTQLALEMSYKNAQTQMKNSLITIDTQKENVELAESVLTNTQNNYKYGLATLTDLLDSERALSDAKNNLNNAKLDYKLAEIEYLKAEGKLQSLK